MNNYPNFKNYNYADMYNNKLNTNNEKTYNQSNEYLFDAYNGFIRGNLFRKSYDPYLRQEPYDIKPMNEQAELLTNIDALCFAMTDLNLYLDIYSDDTNMINLFNQYRIQKENLTKEYESKYGPITLNSDSLNSYPWTWNDMPWPWDN